MHPVVGEDAAGVAVILRTEGGERPAVVSLVVTLVVLLVLNSARAGHLWLLHQPVKVLDVVDGLVEDLYFGHFLHRSSSGYILS